MPHQAVEGPHDQVTTSYPSPPTAHRLGAASDQPGPRRTVPSIAGQPVATVSEIEPQFLKIHILFDM